MPSQAEIDRRYLNIRNALKEAGADALLVCGNQYAGFEGAVRYVSGFEIVHRYVYALIPIDEEPTLIFPREARWIGDKKKAWIRDQVWPEIPGEWIRERAVARNWKKLAVHGMDFVMPVRDHRWIAFSPFSILNFDTQFDLCRAVKSDEELVEVRDSMRVIEDGFWALVQAYEPGKTEAEIMAPAVEKFFAGCAGPRMMNILLSGQNGESEAHFKVPGDRRVAADDLLLYSLEVTGSEGYWVEFSRPLIQGKVSRRTQTMIDAYPEALEAARLLMREGETASAVHRAASDIFRRHGFGLGHLSGHSIGQTMLEYPSIGAESDVVLRENMIFSFHPQVVDPNGEACLYTQDTYRIGKEEGENLSRIPWGLYNGSEVPH